MADQQLLSYEDAGETLGVTVPLSAELAGKLRLHQPPQNNDLLPKEPPKLTFLSKKSPNDECSDDEEDDDSNVRLLGPNADPLDDWNEVLPGIEDNNDEQEEDEDENQAQDQGDDQKLNDTTSDDDWPVSPDPPPHMPVVVVNLERLVGYTPHAQEELEQLEHQIHAALWYGSSEAQASKNGGNPQEDDDMEQVLDAAQHFDERVTELMQNGVAQHSTTSRTDHQQTPNHHHPAVVIVPYPDFLCPPRDHHAHDDNFAPRTVRSTTRIWKRLLQPHPIPVVNKLLTHLQECHRSLCWKYQMHKELISLARDEEQEKTRRHQSRALREWKTAKREHQLEQLYKVRETLEHRLEIAVSRVQELEGVRDQAVAMEIRKRRAENVGAGGLEALDLNSTILAFPDQFSWLGLEDDQDDQYYDDQIGPSFLSDNDDNDEYQSDGSGYDAEGDVEEEEEADDGVPEPTDALLKTDPDATSNLPRRDNNHSNKARRKKVAKKRRRRLQEAAKEAEHQSKLDQAQAEEATVRDLCTTTELKMAQAIRAALETKMESVDELLESLQEEAWADEEAQENGEELVPVEEEQVDSTTTEPEFSLLDQVLAMILGSFPPPLPAEGEDASKLLQAHTQKLQAEHSQIVKEWKETFGRLPPSLLAAEPVDTGNTKSTTAGGDRQTQLRSDYGIEENEKEDWDADSDDNNDDAPPDGLAHEQQEAPAPAPQPQRVGLRPGGKARR